VAREGPGANKGGRVDDIDGFAVSATDHSAPVVVEAEGVDAAAPLYRHAHLSYRPRKERRGGRGGRGRGGGEGEKIDFGENDAAV